MVYLELVSPKTLIYVNKQKHLTIFVYALFRLTVKRNCYRQGRTIVDKNSNRFFITVGITSPFVETTYMECAVRAVFTSLFRLGYSNYS